jgi:hypothetical protein
MISMLRTPKGLGRGADADASGNRSERLDDARPA